MGQGVIRVYMGWFVVQHLWGLSRISPPKKLTEESAGSAICRDELGVGGWGVRSREEKQPHVRFPRMAIPDTKMLVSSWMRNQGPGRREVAWDPWV